MKIPAKSRLSGAAMNKESIDVPVAEAKALLAAMTEGELDRYYGYHYVKTPDTTKILTDYEQEGRIATRNELIEDMALLDILNMRDEGVKHVDAPGLLSYAANRQMIRINEIGENDE